jgi:hypothetical protein
LPAGRSADKDVGVAETRVVERRVAGWCAGVAALGLVVGACAGSTRRSAAEDERGATSTTVTTAPPVPTKAQAIAYIDAACQRFFSLDPIDPGASTNRELVAKAKRRAAAIAEARQALTGLPLPPADIAIASKATEALEVASSAVDQLVGVRADGRPVAAADYDLMRSSQDALTELALALIRYGAKGCVPQYVNTTAPPPPDAGRLVDVRPTVVVRVSEVLANNALIEADTSGAYVGVVRTREVVKVASATNKVVWRASTGDAGPEALVAANDVVWARTRSSLVSFDPATGRRLKLIPVPPYPSAAGNVFGLVVSSTRVWECRGPEVRAIDPSGERIVWSVTVDGRCTALADAGDDLVVIVAGEGAANGRLRIAKSSGRIVARGREPTRVASTTATVDIARHRLYLALRGGPVITDLDSLAIVSVRHRAGGLPNASCLAGDGLFFIIEAERRVLRYDVARGALDEFVAGPGANDLACAGGALWVTNSDAGTVTRYQVEPWTA